MVEQKNHKADHKVSKAVKQLSAEEIESGQPVVNIGLVGHVDHGKTTLTEQLTGRWTDTHSEEIKRGITIRLGYANSIFRKCVKCSAFTTQQKCECGGDAIAIRKVSFVDAPGHESLMATMLSGATIMDGALLLVAANENCPQPQTREHLMALEIIGIKNIVIVQNKVDLIDKERALKNYKQIKDLLKGTSFENAPIIPISAQKGVNVDKLIAAIEEIIPTPHRDETKDPVMFIARSFDINKPGADLMKLKGGVLGGSLIQGKLAIGDQIEIKPGYEVEERNQKVYKPIRTRIISLMTGDQVIKEAYPGGSIAVQTTLDPAIVKSDKLTGNVVGFPEKLPITLSEIKLEVHLLERVVGTKDDVVVEPIKKLEPLMLNVNSAATVGIVTEFGKNSIICKLKLPICCEYGSRITISRRLDNRFRLIGYGILKK
ncbi:translation initiation factor IF-2 subunit gamma [Candidatus Woesearchaeota archaeon]|nr:translation initiation factor IF-2 subunit gamma [Candidatus Woesearchaeota archaeon]